MIIIALLGCLLTHTLHFCAAQPKRLSASTAVTKEQQIKDLQSRFDAELLALEKEGSAIDPNAHDINLRYEQVQQIIYKMRFIDVPRTNDLIRRKNVIIKEIGASIDKAIKKKLTLGLAIVNQIVPQDFSQADKSIQFKNLLNDALDQSSEVSTLLQLNFLNIDSIFPSGLMYTIAKKTNAILHSMIQQLKPFMLERSYFNEIKRIIDYWIESQKNIYQKAPVLRAQPMVTFEQELASLEKNAWISDARIASEQLKKYLLEKNLEGLISLPAIKKAVDLYQDYLAKVKRAQEVFPGSVFFEQQIPFDESMKQNCSDILFNAIMRRIKKASDEIAQIAKLADPISLYEELKESMKITQMIGENPYQVLPWFIFAEMIQQISQLNFKYSEYMMAHTPKPEIKKQLINEYDKLSKQVKDILLCLERNTQEFAQYPARLTKETFAILPAYPKMYGRILGRWEMLSRILFDLGMIQVNNVENLFAPFRKTHKEIGEIVGFLEKNYAQKMNTDKKMHQTATTAAPTARALERMDERENFNSNTSRANFVIKIDDEDGDQPEIPTIKE
jgi:hypothetical protein